MSILTIIIDGIVDVYVGLFDLKRYRPVWTLISKKIWLFFHR